MKPLKRILMVEDDLDIQMISRISLENIGNFVVEMCNSGPEALEKAPLFMPDLILMDVMMPEMDGPTAIAELRKIDSLAEIPFIFMTAAAQDSEKAFYKSIGAMDIIVKPFDPMTLASCIDAIWRRHHG